MAKQLITRNLKYIDREFNDFRNSLIEYSQTYFPQTYSDFSNTSPGMMFIEQASYVGDILSFYLDNQLQENFTQYARQTNNIFELAYMFGYKPKTTSTSTTTLDVFQQLPAKSVSGSIVPDYDYALKIPINSTFGSSYLSQNVVDFSISSSLDPTEITVYQLIGNEPQYFLLKKQVKVISGNINSTSFSFGNYESFPTVNITNANIIKILNVTDDKGNRWYEVDHLGQEMVYDSIKNTNINDPNVNLDTPFLLRLKKTPYRFSTKLTSLNNLQIQFGSGNPENIEEEIVPNPNNVGIGLPFKQDKLTTSFSPTNFLYTNTYGIAPSNTTIRLQYLTGGGVGSNAEANTIKSVTSTERSFSNRSLNNSTSNYIFQSLSCNNPNPVTGGGGGDTVEEIRQNTLMEISSQKRAVTPEDYMIRALSMPKEYGAVSKIHVEKPKLTDNQVSTIETICLYVLSLNQVGSLSESGIDLKNNLKNYLTQYRIIGDSIDIKDAYVINIAIEFEIIVLPDFNNEEVLTSCIEKLKDYFLIDKWQINQPIILRELFVNLDRIKGVQTVTDIKIYNKAGTINQYSQYSYDIDAATQNKIIYPSLDPSIFEVKFPDQDIKGRVVPL